MVVHRRYFVLVLVLAFWALSACSAFQPAATGGVQIPTPAAEATAERAATSTPLPPQPGAPTPTPGILVNDEAAMPERIPVRWFVGLGAGSDPAVIQAQRDIVAEFNASQDEIELLLEIVSNDIAAAELRAQIDSGNAPDLVGPIGILGRASFPNEWLDLTPYIEKYKTDLSDFDPALVNFYRVEEGLVSIPFAVFPSFLVVNTDAFDAAGLPYPPQVYGRPYIDEQGREHPWNMETLRMVAMKLTLDETGKNALNPAFDPDTITQFGYGTLRTDLRGRLALFGGGNFVNELGRAEMPDHWRAGLGWMYDGMWKERFYPNVQYGDSDMLNQGNWFESGNLAMGQAHLWYVSCCMNAYPDHWTTAAVPSYNGVVTAKLHADSFAILRDGANPEAAFRVMTWMLGEKAGDLAAIYGGMPARQSLQADYFAALNERFPGQSINWETVTAGLSYPDSPSHEEALPAYLDARARYLEFETLIDTHPDLDLDAEIESLLSDLNGIYARAR